jgi:hypothetical protein
MSLGGFYPLFASNMDIDMLAVDFSIARGYLDFKTK